MLTSARLIFEHVPAAFADPVGLAEQQAAGVVSLIVVRYPGPDAPAAVGPDALGPAPAGPAPAPQPDDALGPVYDAFVAVSGGLLAVARTTADYRYPVAPSVALARFFEHRDGGRPATLSLYELAEADCTRFVETVYFSECLKLHVDGRASAALVAQQVARSACAGGILEVNDFSDPERPRIRLVDLADVCPRTDDAPDSVTAATGDAQADALEDACALAPPNRPADASLEDPAALSDALSDALADALAPLLDGVRGRVLLFDRAKNHAALPHRSGRPFDLLAAVEEANRLAEARRAAPDAPAPQLADVEAAEVQTEAVEAALRGRHPRSGTPEHPHAQGLAVLVAELQGRGRPATSPAPPLVPCGPEPDDDGPARLPALHLGGAPLVAAPLVAAPLVDICATEPPPDAPRTPAGTPAERAPRHVLATELDRLRADVYALVEDAVGRDRAVPHEAHVLDVTGIPTPVPAERTVDYLRALLCEDPPKRWHFFKRSRAKTFEVVCGKLLAFHAANGHVESPVVHEVNRLWARLCS